MSQQPSSKVAAAGRASRGCVLWSVVVVFAMLAACSAQKPARTEWPSTSARPPAAPSRAALRTAGEQAAVTAVRQVGVPYRYGGNDRASGFDCSGLVQFAWFSVGKNLPRTTGELWRHMEPVAGQDLRIGDVLFFDIEGKVSHVGLYLGSRRFVHAPATGREVTVADLDNGYYRNAFIRGGRPR